MIDFTNLNDVYHLAMIFVGVWGVVLSTILAVNTLKKKNSTPASGARKNGSKQRKFRR